MVEELAKMLKKTDKVCPQCGAPQYVLIPRPYSVCSCGQRGTIHIVL